jgi:ADP-ribose pyrophosphatase YjhB (NUDIX family)
MEENIVREFLSTVYVIRGGNVLFTFNKKVQKFVPIGGYVEKNELPCDSVIREAKEESGFDIKLISTQDWKYKSLPQNLNIQLDIIKPDHHHINISYIGIVVGGEMLNESDEGTELKWFSSDELINSNEIFDNTRENALMAIKIMENYNGKI